MKKLLLILIIIVFGVVFSEKVAAQELDISLIEYIPDTNRARVQIENTLPIDLHNVKFQLDTFPTTTLTQLLKQGTAVAKILNVPPGMHTVTISSDEIILSKKLSFQASIEEKLEEYEDEQREKRRTVQREKILEQEVEKNAPIIEEKKKSTKLILIIVIAIIVAIVAYFLISRRKNEDI